MDLLVTEQRDEVARAADLLSRLLLLSAEAGVTPDNIPDNAPDNAGAGPR